MNDWLELENKVDQLLMKNPLLYEISKIIKVQFSIKKALKSTILK
jgi:hypothetical protein